MLDSTFCEQKLSFLFWWPVKRGVYFILFFAMQIIPLFFLFCFFTFILLLNVHLHVNGSFYRSILNIFLNNFFTYNLILLYKYIFLCIFLLIVNMNTCEWIILLYFGLLFFLHAILLQLNFSLQILFIYCSSLYTFTSEPIICSI